MFSMIFSYFEICYPFSHGKATADFIRKNYPKGVLKVCYTARQNVSVIAFLDDPFFIFDRKEMGSFSKWGRIPPHSLYEISDEVFKLLPKEAKAFLIIASGNEAPRGIPPNFYERYHSSDHEKTIWSPYGEDFYVYEVVRLDLVNSGNEVPIIMRGPIHTFAFPSEFSQKLRSF